MAGDRPDRAATVVLVHHADAVGPDVNPQRPLSPRGVAQAEWLARHAHSQGLVPGVIWHSGKLRARQTAEPFLRMCNPSAEFRMVRGLGPEDSPGDILGALTVEDRDVLIVSHMPLLPAIARALDEAGDRFPLNGLIVFERTSAGGFVEAWRAQPPD